MQHRPGDLDPDHPGIRLRRDRIGRHHWLHHKRHEHWHPVARQDQLPLPGKAAPLRKMPRDQPIFIGHVTTAPRTELLATIRALTSSGHRRRPVGPSKTTMRETPLRLGTSIRCSIWCSTANLPQTQLQGGMPEIRLTETTGRPHRLPISLGGHFCKEPVEVLAKVEGCVP